MLFSGSHPVNTVNVGLWPLEINQSHLNHVHAVKHTFVEGLINTAKACVLFEC